MRHGKKINHLGRTYTHRKALLSNLAIALILNKRIETTVAKARELRKFIEPLITRSKPHNDNTHNRRMVFSYLQNKEAVKELFGVVGEKISERPGGYTRIIKLGARFGDNAEMCIIELVDFNEIYGVKVDASKAKTRRSRRGGKSTTTASASNEVIEDATLIATTAIASEAVASEEVETNNEAIEDTATSTVENDSETKVTEESATEAESPAEAPVAEATQETSTDEDTQVVEETASVETSTNEVATENETPSEQASSSETSSTEIPEEPKA
ncbi:MAG: 50S ribosomal protein L17 [candidate division WS2 bacterium]|uniref:Large ribosomal subunit protein bL17 n=1 Tax=Psychracetigena formicireducens TaxID=2986056 RepID=A0A9E2BK52_PSYF1|nr:50S ribosomal protein L17 [Candidatus Psychracetigena formicireducens]